MHFSRICVNDCDFLIISDISDSDSARLNRYRASFHKVKVHDLQIIKPLFSAYFLFTSIRAAFHYHHVVFFHVWIPKYDKASKMCDFNKREPVIGCVKYVYL